MEYFGFGVMSLVVPVVFVLCYLGFYQLRRFAAVVDGTSPPTDNRRVKASVIFVLATALGCFAQPQFERGKACRADSRPLLACMVLAQSEDAS
jgi:Na+/proline symporter